MLSDADERSGLGKSKGLRVVLGVALTAVVIAGCTSHGGSNSPSTSTASSGTAAGRSTPASGSGSKSSPASGPTTGIDGGGTSGSFPMPNEIGQILQDAQDDIQRVSGNPVFVTHSHDLRGHRSQVLDRDWQVCTQNIPRGKNVGPKARIDLGVVKINETCP